MNTKLIEQDATEIFGCFERWLKHHNAKDITKARKNALLLKEWAELYLKDTEDSENE